jgi:hypothetical protein
MRERKPIDIAIWSVHAYLTEGNDDRVAVLPSDDYSTSKHLKPDIVAHRFSIACGLPMINLGARARVAWDER